MSNYLNADWFDPQWDRFDIAEAYKVVLDEYHVGGVLQERERTGKQLHDIELNVPPYWKGFQSLSMNAREIYWNLIRRYNLPRQVFITELLDSSSDEYYPAIIFEDEAIVKEDGQINLYQMVDSFAGYSLDWEDYNCTFEFVRTATEKDKDVFRAVLRDSRTNTVIDKETDYVGI